MLRDDGHLVVRVFESTGVAGDAADRRAAPAGSSTCGAATLGPFTGELALGPWEIATVRLDEPA